MIEGVILAAGYSSRAKVNKLIQEIAGKPLLVRCIEGMYGAVSRILVVGGYKINALRPLLKEYPKCELVYNSQFEKGMFSSVLLGLRLCVGDRVFITPGDYPYITEEVYQRLLKDSGEITVPVYNNTLGHPVLLSKNMISQLLSAPRYLSLQDFIAQHNSSKISVETRGILMDIDTPEDFVSANHYGTDLL